MRAFFEHIRINPGESWSLQCKDFAEIPFLWHYHPEFELTLVMNGCGQRYVGDSVEPFESGDLVMIGPNQPHSWASNGRLQAALPIQAVVAWFSLHWLDRLVEQWPEMMSLEVLRRASNRGIRFSRKISLKVRPLMLSLPTTHAARRLPLLLTILATLAEDDGMTSLASHASVTSDDRAQTRLSLVLARIHADARNAPSVPELAASAAMSVGAFHRWFKRHAGMTALAYISQLRIGTACQLLINTELSVRAVAEEAGFRNLAHFNRQFLRLKRVVPTEFRASFRRRSEI
ncbi:helix-turn-helix domain-containing protein [Roseateles noduli]|uniref:cupin domain-containing protein n=1 Tax=Roseateles noduli TaxID=2052484 RepID=UPI003D6606D8